VIRAIRRLAEEFHKIGRSNDHGRRSYEIGLQLPEKLEVVHTIETDDAVGNRALLARAVQGKTPQR
jgi:hypothetical protein